MKILLLMLIGISSKAQLPKGFPSPFSTSWYRVGWLQNDSGLINASRDTLFSPRFVGTEIFWAHPGVDTAKWIFTGAKWVKELKTGDAGNAVWGGIQGILSNQTDLQAVLNSKLSNVTGYITAGTNISLGGLGTQASPYIINSTGAGAGSVTSFSFTNGNGIIGTVTNSTSTPALSLGTSLNGIINANGTGFGTVTIGSGLNYAGGVLTATGGTSLNGLIFGNGSIFATASIGPGLSFIGGTLTNTINNTNQLTNGAGFITNITSLISAGANISISGSGTTGSPFVISSTGGGTVTGSGNLSPLFNTSIVSNTLTFSLLNAVANSVFGNNTGSTGLPVYYVPTSTTISGWLGFLPVGSIGVINSQTKSANGFVIVGSSFVGQTSDATFPGLMTSLQFKQLDSLNRGLKRDTISVVSIGTGGFTTMYAKNDSTLVAKRFVGGTNITLTQASDSSFVTISSTSLTNPMTSAWDIIVGGVTGVPARLGQGANGTFLGVSGGTLQYLTPPGAVTSVAAANGSLTISPTSGVVLAAINPAFTNSFSVLENFTALTASSTVTLTGTTFAGPSLNNKLDVVVKDTTTGIVYQRSAQYLDTSGLAKHQGWIPFWDTTANNFKMEAPPSGGSGNTNANVGSGFRLAFPNTNNIRTLVCVGCTIDSTTNANALTFTVSSGSGTVTSVATGFGLTGGPITATGTILVDSSVMMTKNTAQTATGAKVFTGAFTTTSTVNMAGVTYSAGGSSFDVLVTDTSAGGKVWRQPYYQFDTTGFAAGATVVNFGGTKLTLSVGGVTTPGGSTTQVQYNLSGAFAGSANMIFNGSNQFVIGGGGAPPSGYDIGIVLSRAASNDGFYARNTSTTGEAIFTLENDRGSLSSYGAFLYGGSANAIGNVFGLSRADKLMVVADGANNLGMLMGTLVNSPLVLGTNGTERARIVGGGNLLVGTTTDNEAFIQTAANTTTNASILFNASSSVNVTSPTSGMMWWNGTNLNFRTGSATVDLLGGVKTIGTFSGTSISNGASISGTVLTVGVGDGTNPGMISTTTQTIAGNKFLSGLSSFGGTSSSGERVFISGNSSMTGNNGERGAWLSINRSQTNTDAAGGSVATISTAFIGDNTFAAASTTTYTNAASLMINGPVGAGTNVTITNPWALYVASGKSNFNGDVILNSNANVTATHFIGNVSSAAAAGTGAGTGPTITLSGTDNDGSITVLTGTTPSGSGATVVTITYGLSFPTNSYVILTPANAITAALNGIGMVFTTANTTTWTITSGTTALTTATTYKWFYHVGGN